MEPVTLKPATDLGALMLAYRAALDQCDEVNHAKSIADERRENAAAALRDAMKAAGLDEGGQLREHGVTVTLNRQWTAQIDDWAAFKKWAVESGNEYVIHNRLSIDRLMELTDSGTALPPCVVLDSHLKLNHRRTSGA